MALRIGGQYVRGAAGRCKVPLDSSPEGGHLGSEHHPHRRKGWEVGLSPGKEALSLVIGIAVKGKLVVQGKAIGPEKFCGHAKLGLEGNHSLNCTFSRKD